MLKGIIWSLTGTLIFDLEKRAMQKLPYLNGHPDHIAPPC